jgi:hypothetical protein
LLAAAAAVEADSQEEEADSQEVEADSQEGGAVARISRSEAPRRACMAAVTPIGTPMCMW